jgi:hypothetical protein
VGAAVGARAVEHESCRGVGVLVEVLEGAALKVFEKSFVVGRQPIRLRDGRGALGECPWEGDRRDE